MLSAPFVAISYNEDRPNSGQPVRRRVRFHFDRLFDPDQYLASVFVVIEGRLLRRPVMSTYHVTFFKNLLSSDGHPFKCLQRRIDVTDAESAAQAAESASRAFEALYGCPWKLHANLIEINADPDQLIETRSNIRAIWPS